MGHKVATKLSRPRESDRVAVETLKKDGSDVTLVAGDVASPESAEIMINELKDTLGPVDILVNNAGITRDTTFHKMKVRCSGRR